MAGHNVQYLPHAVGLEGLAEGLVVGLGTNLGIQGLVVRDVIAMHAPRPGLKKRGGIAVGDAQGVQVGHNPPGIPEGESGMKLETIGGLRAAMCARKVRHDCRP
jgi:hypothetical protein